MNRFAAAPLILVALGLAACGGGDGDAPSEADFASRANNICKHAETALENVGENAKGPDEVAAAVDKVIAETQKSIDELQDLERPDGEAGEAAKEFVDALSFDIEEKGIPALEDVRDALKDNDQQAVQKAAQKLQAIENNNSNELARNVGANSCAS